MTLSEFREQITRFLAEDGHPAPESAAIWCSTTIPAEFHAEIIRQATERGFARVEIRADVPPGMLYRVRDKNS